MSYKQAQKMAELGAVVTVIIIDSLWHYHNFVYDKEKFPDMSFREFVAHFWKRFGDDKAAIRFRS